MRSLSRPFLLGAALAVALFAACGGSPGGSAATPERDAGGDGAVDHTSDGGPDGADATNGTADGNADEDALDGAPADANGPPFPCGSAATCFEVTQFCAQVTGPHGGTFFTCEPVPPACASDLSCACLAQQQITSPCSESDGGILVIATEP